MIDSKLEKAINDQINKELQAWYSYLAMSAYCKKLNLSGFASFMDGHAREEQAHAHRLMNYVLDRDGSIVLQRISAPAADFNSLLHLFELAVEQERSNTRSIYELYELAKQVNDYSTVAALQWFLDEQVEEEKVMTEALGLMRFAGDDKSALLTLNSQFGKQATVETPSE
ncbi:MAG TPA: ferritin [Candidatus Polarisedimenticolaceae bacterium]|nr:ferritin [Candidatus Polarisedimenticolaceae bacterium]